MSQWSKTRGAIQSMAATKSATEIASELGCSRQWTSRVIADARWRAECEIYEKPPAVNPGNIRRALARVALIISPDAPITPDECIMRLALAGISRSKTMSRIAS